MKLGIAGLGHETITFWPGVTSLEAFKRDELLGRNVVEKRRGTNTPIRGFLDICEPAGVELYPVVAARGRPPLRWPGPRGPRCLRRLREGAPLC